MNLPDVSPEELELSFDPPNAGIGAHAGMDIPEPEAFHALMAEYDRLISQMARSQELLIAKVEALQQELEYKNRLLARKERLAALGEMAAGVAHEIRNPLGGISLYVEMLSQDVSAIPGAVKICSKIASAVQRMNHIVEAILGFTRQLEPVLEEIATRMAIDDAVDMVRPQLESLGASVELTIASGAENLRADSRLLHQVLVNLLRNACEVTPEQGVVRISASSSTLDIVVDSATADTTQASIIEIEVEDQGPGIPDDVREKLFTPFFTTKASGTGLGLATCQRIMESHGGSLSAHNREAGGACFRLRIPLR